MRHVCKHLITGVRAMRSLWIPLCMSVQAGCMLLPPKPAECRGEFKPINANYTDDQKLKSAEIKGMQIKNKLVSCHKGAING